MAASIAKASLLIFIVFISIFVVNVSVFIGRVTENWPQSYRKSHEIAPDKTEKVSAEGVNMKLVSEFHPRHPIFGHVGGFFVRLSVTLPHEIVQKLKFLAK